MESRQRIRPEQGSNEGSESETESESPTNPLFVNVKKELMNCFFCLEIIDDFRTTQSVHLLDELMLTWREQFCMSSPGDTPVRPGSIVNTSPAVNHLDSQDSSLQNSNPSSATRPELLNPHGVTEVHEDNGSNTWHYNGHAFRMHPSLLRNPLETILE